MSKDPIAPSDPLASPREQTDESLRTERGAIDSLIRELTDVDSIADGAITRARRRADEVLAATRAKTDRVLDTAGAPLQQTRILRQARAIEDRALQDERSEADEALQDARTETATRLASERANTDEDLTSERAESDEVLATRDEVLQIVSHELRNMLGTISGMAALIEEDGDPSEGDSGTVAHARWIGRAAARMNRLLGDLTDVASIEAGTLALAAEMVDPAAIVSEAVSTFQLLAAERSIELVAEIASPVPPACVDPARIYQVVTNLVSNAIKFTPRDGKVVVRVDRNEDDIRFSVGDTGIGIAAGSLTRVFTRSEQLVKNDRRGAGLGLYISRSIVRRHGGRIWAESVPGTGSTFFFTVPIAPASEGDLAIAPRQARML